MPAAVTIDIDRAATALKEGKLVAIPTETVYGLGADALNERAAAAIFAAKRRPAFDPLIIHQSSAARLLKYADSVPRAAVRLAEAFWPGPLTLVLPKRREVPDIVTAGLPTVALRVPDHPLTRSLLERVDFPVAAPSANPFGFVSPTTSEHVLDQLGDRIDLVLDGGPCRVGLESTIIGFPAGWPTVYRKGGLPLEAIEAVLNTELSVREHSTSRPDAPGMLSQHYSPGCPIRLFADLEVPAAPPCTHPNLACVVTGRGGSYVATLGPGRTLYDLSPAGDPAEAAARLFAVLRELHRGDYDLAYIELLPETGLGRAINDRLRRAAAVE